MPMTMPKASSEAVRLFEELTPKDARVSTKKVFGQPAAFVTGNMFFGVFGENLFLRLSESDRADAGKISGFTTFEPMPGRAMKEYRVLPTTIRANRAQARLWVDRPLQYASGLAPKKTKT